MEEEPRKKSEIGGGKSEFHLFLPSSRIRASGLCFRHFPKNSTKLTTKNLTFFNPAAHTKPENALSILLGAWLLEMTAPERSAKRENLERISDGEAQRKAVKGGLSTFRA